MRRPGHRLRQQLSVLQAASAAPATRRSGLARATRARRVFEAVLRLRRVGISPRNRFVAAPWRLRSSWDCVGAAKRGPPPQRLEEERLVSAAELAKGRAGASGVADFFARFAGGGAAIGRADEGCRGSRRTVSWCDVSRRNELERSSMLRVVARATRAPRAPGRRRSRRRRRRLARGPFRCDRPSTEPRRPRAPT